MITNFWYDPPTQTLNWDPVPEAEQYEVEYKSLTAPDYVVIYTGTNTSCPFNPGSGTYLVKGRVMKKGSWGLPTNPPVQITI